MAYQTIQGVGPLFPRWLPLNGTPAFSAIGPMDATGEQIMYIGPVWFKERTGTKAIRRVCFRWGAITKSGGSNLVLSLQDVSSSAGPPGRGDGTPDQTYTIANADAGFAANTWYRTGTLSADRTVSYGEMLAIVIDFDGSGRQAPDSINLAFLGVGSAGSYLQSSYGVLNSGTLGALGLPNVILEFDDGSFGTLDGSTVLSAINTHTANSGTGTADEFAIVLNFPTPRKVDALWAHVTTTAGSDFELALFLNGATTATATVAVDQNQVFGTAGKTVIMPIPETILAANQDHLVSVRPTTANNISVYSRDVSDANHWTCEEGGVGITYSTRLNQGSWAAATATRRLIAGVRMSAYDDGAGAAGGILIHPGMCGGLRG